MVESDSPWSPLESVSAGERAAEAFELLANETRLGILVALWEHYEPFDDDTAVRFSELRARVGTGDSGRFNYHLDRLDGHFVESTDDGYVLREAGLTFVQSVIAGAGIEEPGLDPARVDSACTLCGAPAEITYEDGWVYVRCTECGGLWTDAGDGQDGHLAKFSLDPAGLADRTPNEIYAAAWVHSFQRIYDMIDGVCPTCSGRVERSLERCADHDPEGVCPNCGRREAIVGRLYCTVCKEWAQMTLGVAAAYHPAVVAFYYDRGLEVQYGFNDLEQIERRLTVGSTDVALTSEDPPRVRVTIEVEGDEIRVEFDENLAVVAVDE